MEKIIISHVDLTFQKITEFIEGWLELHTNYIRYRMSFFADEPEDKDDLQGKWNNLLCDIDEYITRSSITGVCKAYTESGKWKVNLLTLNDNGGYNMYFNMEAEAQVLFLKLVDYMIRVAENFGFCFGYE